MEARLVELAGLLRRNGLRVSPAEVVDAASALACVGVDTRDAVSSATGAATTIL